MYMYMYAMIERFESVKKYMYMYVPMLHVGLFNWPAKLELP